IAALTRRVNCPVLVPGAAGYDQERTGFQTAHQHRPPVIVAARAAADVSAAVGFAADGGLPVAIQGAGHGLVRACTEGVLISTRQMTGVRVAPGRRTARLEAGTRWDQVIRQAAQYGLAPLNGSAPQLGAVPYILGGGLGPLAREFGYACDRVRGIEIVTADSHLSHVSATKDRDLFWDLRGGRGNFGVVTAMEIDLVPAARLYGGALYFDAELIPAALHAWRQWTGTVPPELTSSVALVSLPDAASVPGPLRGRPVAHVRIAFTGSAAVGADLVAPMRTVGPRLVDTVGEMPYEAVGSIHNDPVQPMAYRTVGAMLSDLDEPAVQALLEQAVEDTADPLIVELRHLGGALAAPPAVASAVAHRDAGYLLILLSPLRPDGAGAATAVSRHELLLEKLGPAVTGRCLNFMHGEYPAEQVKAAYSIAGYRRLRQVKAIWDPQNIFCLDHNILPGTDNSPVGHLTVTRNLE